MKKQFTYHCSCGAQAHKRHSTFKVKVPALDSQGRPVIERVLDKETGQFKFVQRMVEKEARGLGHWHCARGCSKRTVTIERDSGREESKRVVMVPHTVTRDIRVVRQ